MATDGDVSPSAGIVDGGVAEMQRSRILDAVVEVVAEHGVAGTSVGLVCTRAGVSRGAFYERFAGLEECLIAVLDGALARAAPLVVGAFTEGGPWQEGMRAALAQMLAFFDEEPALTRVCLLELLTAAPVVREHRERILGAFAALVIARIGSEVSHASPLAAEGTYASVVGIVNARLTGSERPPLLGLLGPLMGVIVGPFMDDAGVAREVRCGNELADEMLERRRPRAGLPVRVPDVLLSARAQRARLCLTYIAEQSGRGLSPSNRQVGEAIGVSYGGQVSVLLGRLAGLGLLVKHAGGPGRPNEWSLTATGEQVAIALTEQHA
jgi:AcrR family transcriptional regulator